jgi:hypothetical protein
MDTLSSKVAMCRRKGNRDKLKGVYFTVFVRYTHRILITIKDILTSKVKKVNHSHYTPWRRLGGEEV